jgi:signal transduction histidine kinase
MLSLQRALLMLIATALLAGIIPAGVALDRQIARELEDRAYRELALAPRVLADRNKAIHDALVMRAEKLARAPGMVEALHRGDRAATRAVLETQRGSLEGQPVVVDAEGRVWVGPALGPALIEATRRGETPMGVVSDSGKSYMVALAPVERAGAWIGAVGVTLALDSVLAVTLAGVTRSDVLLMGEDGITTAATLVDTLADAISGAMRGLAPDERVRRIRVNGQEHLVAKAPLGDRAAVVFVRGVQSELGVLPRLRGVVGLSGGVALVLGLLLGALLAVRLARPMRSLAAAADRLAEGDFTAPIEPSQIREFRHVGQAFSSMRRALAARLEELGSANRELADRQTRLTALQWELLQRERLAVSGRLVAQLAHEIRNPVASVRNCLELVHRRLRDDPEGQEFAEMAIHELLRMHELAERMLDLNRPRDASVLHCEVRAVVREVAALVRVGVAPEDLVVSIVGEGEAHAAVSPDTLKQVLLNLIQNARDAVPNGLEITITVRRGPSLVSVEVRDNGPGIAPEILPRVFDPFFTTKGTVGGVGLGLFIAEVIVRIHGGRIVICSQEQVGGACFRIELVPAEAGAPAPPDRLDAPDNLETIQ